MINKTTIYEQAGGDAPFRRMVDLFYARIERDPLLHPMFPADLAPGREHQFLFLTQYFGGPPRYNELRGHPRLRARHLPFTIGPAERDAWVGHMLAALEQADFPEHVVPAIREYFERSATFLINAEAGADRGTQIDVRG
ncbi:MAG TPA: globin [Roseiflexaceae bacterium]|nr:globin [Roseiflexaceae bacterium]